MRRGRGLNRQRSISKQPRSVIETHSRKGDPPMKLATLRGPTRDGTLLLVDENLSRAVSVLDIAPTMQYALEHWKAVELQLINEFEAIDAGTSRPIIDFQKALAEGKVASFIGGSPFLECVSITQRGCLLIDHCRFEPRPRRIVIPL